MTKGKILIIDDDPDIALATRLCLESANYDVIEARNSVEGLKSIEQNQPDLIVLDVMITRSVRNGSNQGLEFSCKLACPPSLHTLDPSD